MAVRQPRGGTAAYLNGPQPGVALALAGRGQIRADLGRYEYALDDLDQALVLQLAREAETDVRSARALALAGLGRAAEAYDELAATLERDPRRARSRLRAGRIAAILGEQDKIRAEIELALSGAPPCPRPSGRRLAASCVPRPSHHRPS